MADVPASVASLSGFVIGLPLLSVCGTFVALFEGTVPVPVKAVTVGSMAPPSSVLSLPLPVLPMPVAPVLYVFDVAPLASDGTVTSVVAFDDFVVTVPFTVVLLVDIVLTACAAGSRVAVVPALTVVVEVFVVVPVVNVDPFVGLVVPVVEDKEVVGVVVCEEVVDVVPPEAVLAIVTFVVVAELVV